MLQSLREETEGKLQMLSSLRKNGLTSLFKEVRVFKAVRQGLFPCSTALFLKNSHRAGPALQEFGLVLRAGVWHSTSVVQAPPLGLKVVVYLVNSNFLGLRNRTPGGTNLKYVWYLFLTRTVRLA